MNAWGLEDERMASIATETLIVHVGQNIETRSLLAGFSPSIGTILEADREGDTGSELTVELRFRRPGTDGAPRDN